MKNNHKALTLVELIVVITILAVLATVGFISMQGYASSSRDSVRLTDMTNISKGFNLKLTKGEKIPLPEKNIQITASGTLLSYQGDAGKTVLGNIGIHGDGVDPIDEAYYTYATNANRSKYQILGFLEKNSQLSFASHTFANLSNRFTKTKGNQVGIIIDSNTKAPLNKVLTGSVNITTSNVVVDLLLPNESFIGEELNNFYAQLKMLNENSLTAPNYCDTGYIPVAGNISLGQKGFCVAQYEMSYPGIVTTDSSRNTYSYLNNGDIGNVVSQQGNSPIAEITQIEAINECKSLGEGYHLITNKQWVTIARDIESVSKNWSTGELGTGFITNGISHNIEFGCLGRSNMNTPINRSNATITGDTICENKNQHLLSNGEIIWDFAGNVWEHVNKANNISGEGYNDGVNPSLLNITGWGEWGEVSNENRKEFGPRLELQSNNGIGRILQGDGNIFLRGGDSGNETNGGIYSLHTRWNDANNWEGVGFRCVQEK